ncbi:MULTISPECIES: STAS domain-containing protein [unclassified Gilliamella]|uniref:STAS domain-containing protein n=1 Tax=unclassified Gilliamella TaxID=2685620 RepID=UPI00080DB83F|nr:MULTISPECIES: STAS domain-containing protein [Gilliamella]MCX8573984.1 STAS domain-containing protein [Gilliamella sp. B3831]MCX8576215.1 STAS domain-containing protein [Gilliamella sp. B3815]MCX8580043.1 STAS domain-containing protein [Gilliamella sp. B2717]MCX8588123.1 STAS domain-containing protein [Gilliamella sp. B3801]MCX8593063.1 STAS domain-containing protein [Gilliamella sp. B3804]
MSRITTEKQQDILYLKGELDAHSLSDIWSIQNTLLKEVKKIDVAQLIRVDSSGLATLVYFCNKYNVTLDSVNPQLLTLIALYDLQPVILK